jgi:hypothetical protein
VLLDDFFFLLPKLFTLFDRSAEVDEAIHKTLAEFFRTTTTVASEEENELIDDVVGYEEQDWKRIPGTVNAPVSYFQVLAKPSSVFGKAKSKPNPIKKAASNVHMIVSKLASRSSFDTNSDDSVEGAWGKATATIDVAADRCLAYFWHHMSYESTARFERDHGKLLRMQVDVPGSHSSFTVTSGRSKFPGVDSRVLPTKWAWRREENGTLVVGFTFKGTRERSDCKEGSAREREEGAVRERSDREEGAARERSDRQRRGCYEREGLLPQRRRCCCPVVRGLARA